MIRLLKWLIFGDAHMHVWEEIERKDVVRRSDNSGAGIVIYLRCEVCGMHKTFRGGLS